jgi:hypothetical protein
MCSMCSIRYMRSTRSTRSMRKKITLCSQGPSLEVRPGHDMYVGVRACVCVASRLFSLSTGAHTGKITEHAYAHVHAQSHVKHT